MPRRPGEGREKARRGPEIQMPELRRGVFRLILHIDVVVETDAGQDRGGPDPHHAGLPGLGRRVDMQSQHQNGPVLEGQMPRRRRGVVEGNEAFRPCLDG